IYSSTQSLFTVRSSTAKALGIPETELKVTAMPIGGGFGAKFLHLEPLAGALALRARRSVRLVLPRMDDYLSTRPAPEPLTGSNVAQMAAAVGMDPIEFRLKNCAAEGDPLPNGDPWPSIGLRECLEKLRDHPSYREWRSNGGGGDGEGVGVAVGGWLMGVEPS